MPPPSINESNITVVIDPISGQQKQITDGAPIQTIDDNTYCCSHTCCGAESCYFGVKWTPKTKYLAINFTAVAIHGVCVLLIVGLNDKFHRIPKDFAFVSPVAKLHWTNHALIKSDATSNTCSEVSESPHFRSTIPSSPTNQLNLFPPRASFPDFLDPLFDFTNTTLIEYNVPGNELQLNWMMMSFFALSFIFQLAHGLILDRYEDFPRVLHYIEYAFSSPLMIMVMAINVGIKELFIITSLAGLFFGMNILGMAAEGMMHYAGRIDKDAYSAYTEICKLTHIAGWFMFMFAMIPIWKQFDQVLKCSERKGTPSYAYAAIVIESICFFLFGLIQSAGLLEKHWYFRDNPGAKKLPTSILFKYDSLHALLSLTAKIFLAWLLLGPALSVKEEFLEPC
jgi:hypothetical protein